MKVVLVSPYATVAPHFETELEIIQNHLDAGDQVVVLACWGELAGCDFNPDQERHRCEECRQRRLAGLAKLAPRVTARPICSRSEVARRQHDLWPEVRQSPQLAWCQHDGADLGYGVLSSLVSLTRDPQPDIVAHGDRLRNFAATAVAVYESMRRYLQRHHTDRVYVFNGRFAAMRGVLRACQREGVPCHLHERGCDGAHYEIYENALPHDIDYVETRIRQTWEAAAADPLRQSLADQWFIDRVQRVERNWHSFVKGQTRERLPDSWRADRRNVVVFTSSEDEFVAIGDAWRNPLYRSQVEGIRHLCHVMRGAGSDAHLTIRVHPNLARVDNHHTRALETFASPRVTVVGPCETVDTYHLLRSATTVVSFGSSVGIEAVYWRKPSVLLGPSFYQSLGGTYRPTERAAVADLITRPLAPLPPDGARMYGYWMQTHGRPFRNFEPMGLFAGRFKGDVIAPPPSHTWARRLEIRLRRLRDTLIGPGRPAPDQHRKSA